MKRFLHVGCGPARKADTTSGFQTPEWQEVRFDIDPSVEPDIIGTITDMANVPTGSFDAIYSSHNIEHVYFHEVVTVFREFHRVLADDGFAVITCPDLQSVCAAVAKEVGDCCTNCMSRRQVQCRQWISCMGMSAPSQMESTTWLIGAASRLKSSCDAFARRGSSRCSVALVRKSSISGRLLSRKKFRMRN